MNNLILRKPHQKQHTNNQKQLRHAKTYKNAGAKNIYVITTHGLFVGNGLKKIKDSGLVEKVICTNTHPNVEAIKDDFLEVKSIGGLIKENVL